MNEVFKALSHPARRRMVAMLRDGPLASGDIASRFDMAWPTVTAHLAALKAAGLVEAEKDGASVRYRLVISAVEEAVAFMMELMGTGEAAEVVRPAPSVGGEKKA
ncbi:metalloregulator ArsR/SmtB family transcription factor [Caulobacter endophyticus]|uniref:metalloregulator ArsR/SmtB family transcription factor n=1 Tax=Caulobacter endophyticus TaxID=2172652 RepID=UPI00240F747E|nr:metalloregulator ArsR/SmtB family transcription factor [Caulobacter endophyticus]MDG2531951.1 metalloregulator ArsR/SmtB family transcription factor [Caulobacter endophyticus]